MTADPSASESGTRSGRRNPVVRLLVESVVLVVAAVVLALLVKTFLAQAFYIPSESMEPGLRINDRILVEKPSYWFGGEPERGDVVVFADPGGWLSANAADEDPGGLSRALATIGLYPTDGHLVKRVIGVGGDTVRCCDDRGRLRVNGEPLEEQGYIPGDLPCSGPMQQDAGTHAGGCRGWQTKVPEGHLFVMGDNRNHSADSSWHLCSPQSRHAAEENAARAEQCESAFVANDLVVGKVVALVWPFSRWEILHRPETFEDVPDPR